MRYLIFLVALAFIILIMKILVQAGAFKDIYPHIEGELIMTYTSLAGPEDLDIDREKGILYISSTDRRATNNKSDGIYSLNLIEIDAIPIKMKNSFQGEFHPHGISFLKMDSLKYLHVVNHNTQGDYIEFFEIINDSLNHIKSIDSENMCCPNDVAAIGPTECYITNDHGYRSGIMRKFEDYLTLPKSKILYSDGISISEVYAGLKYANGVNISDDKNFLYATHTTGRQLLTFEIGKVPTELLLINRLNLKTGVDNIDIDDEGNIWIGSHPKLLDFVRHAGDEEELSPSQVLKISKSENRIDSFNIHEIFLDDGSILSGSSVAVNFNNHLYIGCVFENKILKIKLP